MDYSSLVCELDNDAFASFVYHRVVQFEGVMQKLFIKNQWKRFHLECFTHFLDRCEVSQKPRGKLELGNRHSTFVDWDVL